MIHNSLRRLILQGDGLLMSRNALMDILPVLFPSDHTLIRPLSWWGEQPTYAGRMEDEGLRSLGIRKTDIPIVFKDFDQVQRPSLAVHFIHGVITADNKYYFSSKAFERQLLEADKAGQVVAHFLHVCSGGGEAWYLDRLSESMRQLTKPVYCFIERLCASAAYYIACHSAKIVACTPNDEIGSIGCMISTADFSGYFEKLGIKLIEEYSHLSPLKNKRVNDLLSGHPEDYITDRLDPYARQFIDEVRLSRQALSSLGDDDPVFQGQDYRAEEAVSNGLIDAVSTLDDALREAYDLGSRAAVRSAERRQILNEL